jgi:hypothetical protein
MKLLPYACAVSGCPASPIAAQVALSVLPLAGAVLVVRSLQRAFTVPLGFEPRHAALLQFDLDLQGYNHQRGRDFQHRVPQRVQTLPASSPLPLSTASC